MKQGDEGPSVLLIKPAGKNRWQLPKGHIDEGEHAEDAAVREVREEGGVTARALERLEPIRFFYQMSGQKYVKTVDFFLMSYEAGSPAEHDHEVDEAVWFPASAAVTALTFETEQKVVREALQLFQRAHDGMD